MPTNCSSSGSKSVNVVESTTAFQEFELLELDSLASLLNEQAVFQGSFFNRLLAMMLLQAVQFTVKQAILDPWYGFFRASGKQRQSSSLYGGLWPCLWPGGWNSMVPGVLFNPSHSMSLWSQVSPGRFRLDLRRNFFMGMVVKHWNMLLGEVVQSAFLEVLKKCVDVELRYMVQSWDSVDNVDGWNWS